MYIRKSLLVFAVLLFCADLMSQIIVPIGPQVASYSATRVRGYHFTATSNWQLCGLYIPTDMSTGPMNVEFVRFTQGPPPAFAATTNNFVSLFYANSVPGTTMIPVPNVGVSSGNIYGTYGARSSPTAATTMMNSYGATATVTNVNGINMTLLRSGMQFPLNNQQMHDIWSEVNYYIGRIFMYHSCCPTPPPPQGPISGPASVCQGDTVQYSVPWDSVAVSYTWSVGGQDSIISGQGDSLITVAIGPNSQGDSVCVYLTDTCTDSSPICFGYTVPLPTTPGSISGPDTVCVNDTASYSIPSIPNVTYTWTLPPGASIVTNPNSNTVDIAFGTASDTICVTVTDSCATSQPVCMAVTVSTAPPLALAGVNQNICSGLATTLQGNNPQIGTGTWTVISGPGGGNLQDLNDPLTGFDNLLPGVYTLDWTITSPGCPSSNDQVDISVGITPDADFVVPNVCQGTPATFVNNTNTFGLQGSYRWDVENDGIDNYLVEDPAHLYGSPGTYVIRMIASASGCADTVLKTVLVNPIPDMDVSVDDVCFEDQAIFLNSSTISNGSISTMIYDFGDGSTPESGNASFAPQHDYPQPGSYVVTTTAISNAGCSVEELLNLTIHHLPEPAFSFQNACQYQTSRFYDQSTVDGSIINQWEWNFGDGSAYAEDADPEHDYNVNGEVPVTLGVWSGFGCYADSTRIIEVFPTPVAHFNYTNKVCLGDSMFMEDVSSIDYGEIVYHRWLVADTIEYFGTEGSHFFPEIGTYSVRLIVRSDEGCVNTMEKEVPVFEVPVAHFTFDGECAGNEIEFRAESYFDGLVEEWKWDFGDSTELSTDRYPVHVFDTHGVYDVTLRVRSAQDCPSTVTYPVVVYENIQPQFGVYPDSGCSPLYVQLVDSSVSKSGVGYKPIWEFGNGDIQEETSQYTYNRVGGQPRIYDVSLRIITDQGCETVETIDSMVFVLPQPIADFTTLPGRDEITNRDPLVQFNSLAEETNYWKWYFGDGETSNLQNPAHFYEEEGEYLVSLITTNIYQCADTVTDRINIAAANNVFIPRAFTPNGDGLNEVFAVKGLEGVTGFTMDIYDRWGNIIFSSTGLDSFWDGWVNQNRIAQQGVYIYRINYVDLNGEPVQLTGEVAVLGVE